MSKAIRLRIILQQPINGLRYGVQKGKGANYEIVQPQIGAGRDLLFEFLVPVKETAKQEVSLGGPFVQGPAGCASCTSTSAAMPGRRMHPGAAE